MHFASGVAALTNDLEVLLVSWLDLTPRPNLSLLLFSSSFQAYSRRGAHQKFNRRNRSSPTPWNLIPEDALSRLEARVASVSLGSSFDDSLRRIGNPLDLFPPIDHSRRDHQTLPFDAILSLARKKKFHYGDKDSDNSRNSRKQVSQGFSCSRSGRDRRCDLGMRIMRPRVRSQINQTRLITDTTDWIKRRTIMVRFVSVIAGPPPPILHETRQRFDQETIAYRTCNLISYQTGYRPQQGMITFTKRYGRGSLIDNSSQEESSPSLSNFLLLSSSSFIDLSLSIQAKVEKTFWKTLPSSRGVAWPHRRHIAGTVFNQFGTFKRSKRYRSKAQHAEEQRLLPRMAATDRPWNRQ